MDENRNSVARMRLDGKVFVVTGANGGIGQGIVERLTAAGAHIVAQVRRPWPVPQRVEEVVATIEVDLRQAEAADQIVAFGRQRFGRVDGLINNAGIQPLVPFESLSDDQWQEMIDVNLTAAHRLSQAVADDLRQREQPGSIVHISSIEARHPTVLHGHYATAKAALVMHAKAAALSYGPDGIRVNAILPGLIDRPGLTDDWPEGVERWMARAPLQRLGTPQDVGDSCVFLCSDMASWITGAELVVDGGVLANPTW